MYIHSMYVYIYKIRTGHADAYVCTYFSICIHVHMDIHKCKKYLHVMMAYEDNIVHTLINNIKITNFNGGRHPPPCPLLIVQYSSEITKKKSSPSFSEVSRKYTKHIQWKYLELFRYFNK